MVGGLGPSALFGLWAAWTSGGGDGRGPRPRLFLGARVSERRRDRGHECGWIVTEEGPASRGWFTGADHRPRPTDHGGVWLACSSIIVVYGVIVAARSRSF